MISDAQLTRMRAQVVARLPQTATIQRIDRLSDGAGGWIDQPVDLGTVPARLDPVWRSDQDVVFGAQDSTVIRYQLTVPHDAPIAADSRIIIGGSTYQVIQMDADHGWRVSRRAIVAEVR